MLIHFKVFIKEEKKETRISSSQGHTLKHAAIFSGFREKVVFLIHPDRVGGGEEVISIM